MPARRSSSVHGSRPGDFARTVRLLAAVGRGSDLHQQHVATREGHRLGLVVSARGEPGDDRLGIAGGLELARGETPPDDAPLERQVEIPVVHGDVVAAAGTERCTLVHGAVAVPVAERRHPAAKQAAARRGVEVAAGRDGQVPHVVDVARHHAGAESVGKAEPSVVGRTRRLGPSRGEGDQGDERNHGERGAAAGSEDERHETTPFLRPVSGGAEGSGSTISR